MADEPSKGWKFKEEDSVQAFDRAVKEGRINAEWIVKLMPTKKEVQIDEEKND